MLGPEGLFFVSTVAIWSSIEGWMLSISSRAALPSGTSETTFSVAGSERLGPERARRVIDRATILGGVHPVVRGKKTTSGAEDAHHGRIVRMFEVSGETLGVVPELVNLDMSGFAWIGREAIGPAARLLVAGRDLDFGAALYGPIAVGLRLEGEDGGDDDHWRVSRPVSGDLS